MDHELIRYYDLKATSLDKDCKVFIDRFDALDLIPNDGTFLEIGTLAGDYARVVIDRKNVSKAVLADTYRSPDFPNKGRFGPEGHLSFVVDRFKTDQRVTMLHGPSSETLPLLNDKFDYIYIDARHDYRSVSKDLENAYRLLSDDGIIGVNDYTMRHPYMDEIFGVVPAVNEFLAHFPEFKIIGFSFNNSMFSDVYLKRSRA